MKKQDLKFGPEQQRTLGLITEDGYYTNSEDAEQFIDQLLPLASTKTNFIFLEIK